MNLRNKCSKICSKKEQMLMNLFQKGINEFEGQKRANVEKKDKKKFFGLYL